MFRKLRPEKYRKDLNQLLEMGTTISEIKNTLKENTRDKDFNERLYMIKEKINELEDIAIETIVDIWMTQVLTPSTSLLYARNKNLEIEIKKWYHNNKYMKYLGIKITKITQTCTLKTTELYWHKLKKTSKWRDILFMGWNTQYC